jgi:hypothetical protein
MLITLKDYFYKIVFYIRKNTIFVEVINLLNFSLMKVSVNRTTMLSILNVYNALNESQINGLIEATDGVSGVSFVSINGYSSDKSNNTEIANQVVNIGASYANMLKKDSNIYANVDLSLVDVDKFNYNSVDTAKLTLEEFKKAVKEIRIEGHTSSFWNGASISDAYFLNMDLSQQRTRSTLKFIMNLPVFQSDEEWLKEHITANGLSSSRPIIKNPKSTRDDEVNQRVEFRIVTNAADRFEQMIEDR